MDEKCKSCAYRVFECTARSSTETRYTMFCLHPAADRASCAQMRCADAAQCGESARLWKKRATQ